MAEEYNYSDFWTASSELESGYCSPFDKKVLEYFVSKQKPMKVEREEWFAVCPVCHQCLGVMEAKDIDYCPNCGQRLDWEEEK